ncbi:MAG: TonB-dependent receptor [Acidobacteriota bacterium]
MIDRQPLKTNSKRREIRIAFFSALMIFIFTVQAAAWQITKFKIEGRVLDQTGAAIVGAKVSCRTTERGSQLDATTTNQDGYFSFKESVAGKYVLVISASGFKAVSREINLQQNLNLDITLTPESVTEQVTITAERTLTRVSETATSVAVLSTEDLTTTSALMLDDALRQVPGFSLFRRSGSRTANPTTQGVSFRGVGASGASRAVILTDGIPLNDPFGGWIYWGRVPREEVSRIEVVRGGASNLYGSDALGGVINFIPRENHDAAFSLETAYGNQQTPSGSFFAGGRFGKFGAQISGQALHTDGYILVDENERGSVDTRAGAEFSTLDATLERSIADKGRVFIRGSVFGESRENGTPLQTNRTHIRQFASGFDWRSVTVGALLIRAYGSTQVYNQSFSAIAANRNSENLTRDQRTPAQQIGFTSGWSRAAGNRQTLVAGFDFREVRGASDELVFAGGRITSAVGAGGRQRIFGIYGQNIIRLTDKFFATIGGRVDRWRNYDGLSTSRVFATAVVTPTFFKDRAETAFSPRLSLLYKAHENVSLFVSGYRAFRAPTLNELYRSFRVGNVLTQANSNLQAERLTGGEAGANLNAFKQRMNLRGTFFWTEIIRPVANVTRSVTPDLITRQRQNLGRTRSRGVEFEAEARLTNSIAITGGYLFADATVRRFPTNRSLEGLWIPQVPRHQMTFQFRYANPSIITVGVQGRAIGTQFDDDQNLFELDKFFTLDLFASRRLTQGVEVFAAFENLFDQKYDIGRTPVRTLGPPILARVGLRLNFGAR